MGLHVEWVTDRGGFHELAGHWDRLALGAPTPFLQFPWMSAWWDAFGNGGRLRICTVWDAGELRGALALEHRRGMLRGLANDHSPTFGPLAADDRALVALAHATLALRLPIALPSLPADDRAAALFVPRRRLAVRGPSYSSPAVELHDDLTAFRSRLRSSLRSRLDRLRRKMHREHHNENLLVEAPADLDRELREGFRLEASGWKGKAGTAIVSSSDTRSFYERVARDLAARDQLRINAIRLDGSLVAWDLCVLFDGRLHLLKTAYDEDLGRLAPALVMRLSVIERCYEAGLTSHELGGGAEPWKREFSNAQRPHTLLRAYPARVLPVAAFGRDRAVEAARRAYRRWRPRP